MILFINGKIHSAEKQLRKDERRRIRAERATRQYGVSSRSSLPYDSSRHNYNVTHQTPISSSTPQLPQQRNELSIPSPTYSLCRSSADAIHRSSTYPQSQDDMHHFVPYSSIPSTSIPPSMTPKSGTIPLSPSDTVIQQNRCSELDFSMDQHVHPPNEHLHPESQAESMSLHSSFYLSSHLPPLPPLTPLTDFSTAASTI